MGTILDDFSRTNVLLKKNIGVSVVPGEATYAPATLENRSKFLQLANVNEFITLIKEDDNKALYHICGEEPNFYDFFVHVDEGFYNVWRYNATIFVGQRNFEAIQSHSWVFYGCSGRREFSYPINTFLRAFAG